MLIAGACLCWGIDNNLTRKLSSGDSVQIAMLKGLVAGIVNITLAFVQHSSFPAIGTMAGIGVVGFFGYGVSLMFFVLALRNLGTARTGAYFSLAPCVGALLSDLLGVVAVFILVAANGFLVTAEFSLVAVRHSRVTELAVPVRPTPVVRQAGKTTSLSWGSASSHRRHAAAREAEASGW